ncbi:MAG: IgGFc-binding protein [Myxococcota bacterium]
MSVLITKRWTRSAGSLLNSRAMQIHGTESSHLRAVPALLLVAMTTAALLFLLPACSDSDGGGGGLSGDTTGGGDLGEEDASLDDTGGEDAPTSGDVDAEDGTGEDVPPAGCEDCLDPYTCVEGYCVQPEPDGCEPGAENGCSGDGALWTCDDSGTAFYPKPCPNDGRCQDGTCTPVICEPGSWFCEGVDMKKQCNADGTGFEEPVECPGQQYCTSGKCGISCDIDPKFGSYVGCTFWTVDLPNYPDPSLEPTPEDLPHAIVVANPGELMAEVSFEPPEGITVDVDDPTIPGRQSRVFLMPKQNVSGTETAMKGIRFTSTRPVLVHQFNPWDNQFSNDASLLLPEPFLGSEYVVLSWPTAANELSPVPIPGMDMPNQSGWFTVLAPFADTEVTIAVTAHVAAGGKLAEMDEGGVQTVTLDKGEVLNVEATPESFFEVSDLTGSTVTANKPVAVFGGHEEAVIAPEGDDSCCADHLEEQFLPPGILGSDYLAVKTKPRGGDVDFWRIQAAEDQVTITTDPPIDGVDGVTLAKRGEWVEAPTDQSFEIHGTGKLQVGQYLISAHSTDDWTGDPSLILSVPVERFRDFYVLMVPPDYTENYVTVVKKPETTVKIDDVAVPESDFEPIGSGTWTRAYVQLEAGVHDASGDGEFGLTAYGFNEAVSYGYPGGMSDPGQ